MVSEVGLRYAAAVTLTLSALNIGVAVVLEILLTDWGATLSFVVMVFHGFLDATGLADVKNTAWAVASVSFLLYALFMSWHDAVVKRDA